MKPVAAQSSAEGQCRRGGRNILVISKTIILRYAHGAKKLKQYRAITAPIRRVGNETRTRKSACVGFIHNPTPSNPFA
jgi:hypothetical protein